MKSQKAAIFRSVIGVVLLGLAMWVGYRNFWIVTSDYAVVSRSPIVMRAPIRGILSGDSLAPGRLLGAGAPLFQIEDLSVDTSHLTELETKCRALRSELGVLDGNLERVDKLLSGFGQREARVRGTNREHLEQLLRLASAEVDLEKEGANRARVQFERSQLLATSGLTSQADLTEAQSAHLSAGAKVAAAEAKLADVDVLLRSAKRNDLVEPVSGSGVLYPTQRSDDLRLLKEMRSADLESKRALLTSLEQQVVLERQRIQRLQAAALSAPVRSRVWRTLATAGEFVTQGQPLAELLNCDEAFVLASLSRRQFTQIHLGGSAHFESDESRTKYTATVVQIFDGWSETRMAPGIQGMSARPGASDYTHLVLVKIENAGGLNRDCQNGLPGTLVFEPRG